MQLPYRVTDPATGAVLRSFDHLDDVEPVLARTAAAYDAWSVRPLAERAELLRRAGRLLLERSEELAASMRSEMGKPLDEGREEVASCRDILDFYADHGPAHLADEPVPSPTPGTTVLQRLPVGPLLGVMPWNFPCYQVVRFAAPNLLLGNTVVVKHAESTPATAAAIEEAFLDAGLPPGVYENVFATHDQVAEMIADDRVRGVSLTGSERAGATVGALAGQHLKKCVLELGGSDPFVVLDAADVDRVADLAWDTRLYNNGQACNSNKRLIVLDGLHDAFTARLEARAHEAATTGFAPLASRAAAERLHQQVADAVAQGARLVGGELGPAPAAYLSPGVLSGVTPAMTVHHQELFGPVCVVYRAADDADALALANDSAYGLGAAVFSDDAARAEAVARRLDVGMVAVNSPGVSGPDLPFGGVGRSGHGRELGRAGLAEFANLRLFHRAG